MAESDNFRRFIASLAAAVGLLVLGLSGTCTAAFLGSSYGNGGVALLPLIVVFGGPFITLGIFTLIAAVHWFRGGRRVPYRSVLGIAYMLLGAIGVLAGAAFLGSSAPIATAPVTWLIAAALLLLGWRITKMP